MGKKLVIYTILLFISICFFILYVDLLSLILLVITISYPISMFAILNIVKKKSNVNISSKTMVCSKNSDIDIKVTIENSSLFPIPNAVINITYQNTLEGLPDRLTAVIPIQARNRQEVNFKLTSKYCGKIEINLQNITIIDYLKLCSIKLVPKQPTVSIVVTPDCHSIDAYLPNKFLENQDSDIFSKTKSGDDPSEIFDIKEYHEGDKINKIHWKLSAKTNYPMVKEYSRPITNNTLIIFDFYYPKTDEKNIEIFDTLAETLLSISFFLIENNSIHTIAWYNQFTDKLESDVINNEEDIFKLLGNIFNARNFFDSPHALINYAHSDSNYKYVHTIYLTAFANSDSLNLLANINNCVKKTLLLVGEENNITTTENYLDINSVNIKPNKIKQCLADFII
jgi:uncharacterized protein (DUF58 family)